MSTTSSDLEGGPRPKLNLLDLPREIRDRIYGYVVCDRYVVVPPLGEEWRTQRSFDPRHLSILRVSRRLKFEAIQVLWGGSSFIYNPHQYLHVPAVHEAQNKHIMNIELIIGRHSSWTVMPPLIDLNFAGTEILRRTCHILIPELNPILEYDRNTSRYKAIRLYFQYIKLLTGFATVVVQVDLTRRKKKRGVEYDDDRAKMLRDMMEFSEPALGPAVPCDSVRERYDVNFRFSPLQFVAKRLGSAELGVGHEGLNRDQ